MPGREVYGAVIDHDDRTELVGLTSLTKGSGAIEWRHSNLRLFAPNFSKPVVLNCFDGYLVAQYVKHGFVEYKRVPFDESISIPKSLKGTRPDVVYMQSAVYPQLREDQK